MTGSCSAVPPGAGFISSMTGYLDCQAQILGSGSWQALAAPGSTLMVVLTGFLTILVALVGYNLLLGRSLTVRSGTLAFVKIGAVFVLATSWPAYRTLVYDLVIDGPAQLVSEIGPQARVTGSDGTLLQRLDLVDNALAQLSLLGPGTPSPNADVQVPPPPFGGFDAFALGGSRILFLLTAISALASVRIVAGLMLALGPFFIAFLMFDNTRSLFEGWVRVLAGSALATVGVTIALGLELAMVEPWLSAVLARRMAGEALPTVATELFVIMALFTIIVVAVLYACARLVRAFRLAPLARVMSRTSEPARAAPAAPAPERSVRTTELERTRAASVASVLVAMNRRESGHSVIGGAGSPLAAGTLAVNASVAEPSRNIAPVGRSFRRQTRSRVSALAERRDSRA